MRTRDIGSIMYLETVADNVKNGVYEKQKPFVSKRKVDGCPECGHNIPTIIKTPKYCPECGSKLPEGIYFIGATRTHTSEMITKEQYETMIQEYNEETRRVSQLFDDHLKECFRTAGATEKAVSEAYRIAWDKGHSSGYSEIVNESYDLVELIEAMKNE